VDMRFQHRRNDIRQRVRLAGLLLAAVVLLPALGVEGEDGGWEIGPRSLPAPNHVSDVMRKALLATPTPDVAAVQGVVLTTPAQWEAWAKQGDVPQADAAGRLAQALSVTVEESTVADVKVHWVSPPEIDKSHANHLFVYIHGGAWVRNAGRAGVLEPVVIAARLKMPVLSIDYRMPPGHPAPAATDDVIAVWRELVKARPAAMMVMGGTSAGANITLSSIHRFKELRLPLPGALYVGTPAVEVAMTGDSRFLNEGVDRLLVSWKNIPHDAGILYAGDYDVRHPHVSPIYGEFEGFPPTYLITGTRDLLLSDTIRAHRKLRRAGVDADLHVYEGQSHGDYLAVVQAPESVEHYAELNAFLLSHLD